MIFRLYPVLIVVLLGSSLAFAQNATNSGDFEESSSNIQVPDTQNSGVNPDLQAVNNTGLPPVPAANSEVIPEAVNNAALPVAPAEENDVPADAGNAPETAVQAEVSTSSQPPPPPPTSAPKTSTTSTTQKPSSTTTPSSVNPAPEFPLNIGNWSVNYPSTQTSCILIKGAIQVQFMNGPGEQKEPQTVDIPVDAEARGICSDIANQTTQVLNLTWVNRESNKSQWISTLELTFTTNPKDANTYSVSKITFFFSNNETTNNGLSQENGMISINGSYFPSSFNKSFSCISQQTIKDNNELRLLTAEFQVEAFRSQDAAENTFDEAEICAADTAIIGTTIGVSIAIILALLIAITSGIYCGVRKGWLSCPCRRSTAGYQRMDE